MGGDECAALDGVRCSGYEYNVYTTKRMIPRGGVMLKDSTAIVERQWMNESWSKAIEQRMSIKAYLLPVVPITICNTRIQRMVPSDE